MTQPRPQSQSQPTSPTEVQAQTQPQLRPSVDAELDRIRAAYAARANRARPAHRYGLFDDAALLHTHSVERSLLALLKRRGFHQLNEARVLDVGCGSGMQLRRCIEYGGRPERLTGIDLLPNRIEAARALHPGITWLVGSAHELPFAPASFDVVLCSTVLSSVLDAALRRQIAAEMLRVVTPSGVIVIHDFVYANPRNPQVRGVPLRELRQLFAGPGTGNVLRARRVVLAPPISRRLAPRAFWLAELLEHAKLLNTHVVAAVYREDGTG